jgi:hypothetical protein
MEFLKTGIDFHVLKAAQAMIGWLAGLDYRLIDAKLAGPIAFLSFVLGDSWVSAFSRIRFVLRNLYRRVSYLSACGYELRRRITRYD